MYKKITIILIGILLSLSFVGCSKSEEQKQKELMNEVEKAVKQYTVSEYHELIRNSRIVNPTSLINSFNADFDLALTTFDKETVAIPVTINDLKQGKLVFDNNGEQSIIDGYYTQFQEQSDADVKTTLICAMDNKDTYLLDYGKQPIDEATGQPVVDAETGAPIEPIVKQFFLVGTINSVIGTDKYNILIKDARLLPATTYVELVVEPYSQTTNVILDVTSSENINEIVDKYHWGTVDFDLDGFCDELIVQTNQYNPDSSFNKLIYNNIFEKMSIPIDSIVQAIYKDKSFSFNINYPLKISTLTFEKSTAFNGTNVNYLKFDLTGIDKNTLDYANKKQTLENIFTQLKTNTALFENQVALCSVSKDGIKPFTVKLLDGREVNTINSDVLFLKNILIDNLGNITGDIFVKAKAPFEFYYKTNLRFLNETTIQEVEADEYYFYDVDCFENTGEFKTVDTLAKFDFLSLKDIPVAQDMFKFNKFEITSDENSLYKVGYGLNDETPDAKVNIFKTGSNNYGILSIKKDPNSDIYWLGISNKDYRGYIPVSLDNYFTYPNTKIKILYKEKANTNDIYLNNLFKF